MIKIICDVCSNESEFEIKFDLDKSEDNKLEMNGAKIVCKKCKQVEILKKGKSKKVF